MLTRTASRRHNIFRTAQRLFSSYQIHPAIGIARLGNSDIGTVIEGTSDSSFYDEPQTFGGLPTLPSSDGTTSVTTYRDNSSDKKLLRQASVFNIYDSNGNKIDLSNNTDIKEITWSVWLANKKSAFYDFRELQGYPLLSPYWFNPECEDPPDSNSYKHCGTPKRNSKYVEDDDLTKRQKLIIDFGPRTCKTSDTQSDRIKHFDATSTDYEYVSHPSKYVEDTGDEKDADWQGNSEDVSTLGYMEVSQNGTLRVIAGPGDTCGKTSISSFAGGDLWWDDISDGPVRAVIKFNDGREDETLTAWCMVGSPKYVPELVNISTMDDVTYDAAVRYNSEFRTSYMVDESNDKFKLGSDGFKPIFTRDIKPILDRMKNYQWVANVGPMVAFANPPFNVSTTDSTIIANELPQRQYWFSLLRQAFPLENVKVTYPLAEAHSARQTLFSDQDTSSDSANLHFPLMPLNSGDNSVMDNKSDNSGAEDGGPDGIPDHSNQIISKFATVTPTQYYFLYQWANGFVGTDSNNDESKLCNNNFQLNNLDRASGGNCVGYPTSPGVETTWNIRVPWIYQSDDPYRILYDSNLFEDLYDTGLDPLRDECALIKDPRDSTSKKLIANTKGDKVNVERQRDVNFDNKHALLKINVGTKKGDKNTIEQRIVRGKGLEPGDLTKRMAIPWQADFSNCSVQSINFTDPTLVRPTNKPAYYTYWWPPQAPWNVYLGYEEKEDQEPQPGDQDGDSTFGRFGELGSGQQVFYQRGIMEWDASKASTSDVYTEMINHWQDLGFVINTSENYDYPYFVEKERNSSNFRKVVEDCDDGSGDSGDGK